jgi:hypothetical protein
MVVLTLVSAGVPVLAPVVTGVASSGAIATEQPVELMGETTPTSRTIANQDGSFTTTVSAEPTRMLRSGQWVSINTDLVAASGGFKPSQVIADLTFSAGGSGPAVAMTSGGVAMRWTWPTPLPAPEVLGDTATYREVLPDVDLRLTAGHTSFSEVLVVRTPQAGAAMAQMSPQFGLDVTGGRAGVDGKGGLQVLDPSGVPAIESEVPLMWDSRNADTAPRTGGSVDEPAPENGAAVASLDVQVTGDSLIVNPSDQILTSSATQYPVYIDPTPYTTDSFRRAMVDAYYPGTSYYQWTDHDQGVGYQDYSGQSRKRLLWRFYLGSKIYRTSVTQAVFSAMETYAGSCVPQTVNAWSVSSFSSSTTWNNQPTWRSLLDARYVSYGRADCTASGSSVSPSDQPVEFDVLSHVRTLTSSSSAYVLLGLRADSETDSSYWKRFSNAGTQLSVTYNHAPTQVSASREDTSGPCATSAAVARPIPATPVKMKASFEDRDGDNLRASFVLTKPDGTSYSSLTTGAQAVGPTSKETTFNRTSATLTVAGTYRWRVTATESLAGGVSGASVTTTDCYFVVDPTAPGPPTVAPAAGQPDLTQGIGVNTSVELAVSPAAVNGADTIRYRWSLNSDTPASSTTVTVPAGTGTTITVKFGSSGPSRLRVWAYDAAGNSAQSEGLEVPVKGWVPSRWALDGAASPATPDPACQPVGVTAVPNVDWTGLTSVAGMPSPRVGTVDAGDQALSFSGVPTAGARTAGSPVAIAAGTHPGYTVSAWVAITASMLVEGADSRNHVAGDKTLTVTSIDAAIGSAMQLRLQPDPSVEDAGVARLAATLAGATATGAPAPARVLVSKVDLEPGWYRLAVTVSPATGRLELTIRDSSQATTTAEESWDAEDFAPADPVGPLRLGSARDSAGALVNAWSGTIDEARQFHGALLTGLDPVQYAITRDLSTWLDLLHQDVPCA